METDTPVATWNSFRMLAMGCALFLTVSGFRVLRFLSVKIGGRPERTASAQCPSTFHLRRKNATFDLGRFTFRAITRLNSTLRWQPTITPLLKSDSSVPRAISLSTGSTLACSVWRLHNSTDVLNYLSSRIRRVQRLGEALNNGVLRVDEGEASNEGAGGEWEIPEKTWGTSDIIRHDSHMRKSEERFPLGIEPSSSWQETSSLTTAPPWPQPNAHQPITGFSLIGIVPDDAAGRDVPFPPPLHYGAATCTPQSSSSVLETSLQQTHPSHPNRFTKVLRTDHPLYLASRFQILSSRHNHKTRSLTASNLDLPQHRTNFYSGSFTVNSRRCWNFLELHLKLLKKGLALRPTSVSHRRRGRNCPADELPLGDLSSCNCAVFLETPMVHVVFDTSWRTVAQSPPSTVTADNQCAVDIGKFVQKIAEPNLQVVELANTAQTSLTLLLPAYYWLIVKWGVCKQLQSKHSSRRKEQEFEVYLATERIREILVALPTIIIVIDQSIGTLPSVCDVIQEMFTACSMGISTTLLTSCNV
ncbi:hypothetical protein PR048_019002 [Dryococelus australis]|uniref:Uncharacterized protein n=1 Tax=Dryococelus australis TaxID=614101 RepID=A0ABQ9H2E0_9NEOP|nr:hypothetical protein PR048_019002 [Dryococelus australis]